MGNYHHYGTNPLADILKALCLGATAVGIGRPFLYAQSVGFAFDPSPCALAEISCRHTAKRGSSRSSRILEREIVYGMQLLGASSVRDLVPEMVSPAVTPRRGKGELTLDQVERINWQPKLPVLAKL
jgi:hypothetical protein